MISLKISSSCRLGSKVAVFRYSSIEIYSATKPPMTLQFHNPNRKDWLDVEVKSVRFYKYFAAAVHFYLAKSFLILTYFYA